MKPMSETKEKKSVSDSKAVVETDAGTRYRALRSGKGGESKSDGE